jgi:hypothetical protein
MLVSPHPHIATISLGPQHKVIDENAQDHMLVVCHYDNI